MLTGFILIFTFLFLCDAKKIKLKFEFVPLIIIKLFYFYLILSFLVSLYIHGFPNEKYNLMENNNKLFSNTTCKYLLFGSITAIVLFFKSFHLRIIPFEKIDYEMWDQDEYEFIQSLVAKKKWRKLNFFLSECYMEDITDERINKKKLQELIDSKL